MDPSAIGPSMQAVTTALTAFNTFLPDLAEIRKADPQIDFDTVAHLRLGEVAAGGIVIGLGAIASALTKEPAPAMIALIAAAGMIFLYEMTLRAHTPFVPKPKVA